MELVIDFDNINDASKKEWLIHTLQLMEIHYHTTDNAQTLEAYNDDLVAGDNEIENGEFISAEDLKKEAAKW